MPPWFFRLLISATASLTISCASPCQDVARFASDFRSRSAVTSPSSPHVRLAIPYALIDNLLAERIHELDPIGLAFGDIAALPLTLLDLRLSVAALRLRHADDQRIGFALQLDLQSGTDVVTELHLDVQVAPRTDGGAMVIGLSGADLLHVQPRLGEGARERMAALLERKLPARWRDRLDADALVGLSSRLLGYLVGKGWDEVRRAWLADAGELAAVRLALPDLPLRLARTHSVAEPLPYLSVDGESTRPVRHGVTTPVIPAADAIRVRISGEAVAELGNWATERGLLPARYDQQMRPDPRGALRTLFDWTPGAERPLLLHVLCDREPCFRLRVEARARAAVSADGQLRFDVYDGRIEAVEGAWTTRLGIWLDRVGEGPIEATQRQIARADFDVYGRRLALGTRSVVVDSDGVTMDLVTAWVPASPDPAPSSETR